MIGKMIMFSLISNSSEIESYFNNKNMCAKKNFNVLSFWKEDTQYPNIKDLVPKVLSIPASSASSERIFSKLGKHITSERSIISSSKAIKSSYISINRNYQ